MNIDISRTPSTAAHLRGAIDRPARHLTTGRALGIIIPIYLLFFGQGIFSAFVAYFRHWSGSVEDYTTYGGLQFLVLVAVQIPAALAILCLVSWWLNIPRALAGIPRRRRERIAPGDPHTKKRLPSPIPAFLSGLMVLIGFALGILVIRLLQATGAPDTNVGPADNPASLAAAIMRCLNAGVCEEVVIVALPVLLGRRAGWHPIAIIALSVVLRWPFHLYHGVESIPWVIVWGSINAATFLYLADCRYQPS